ncbi:hypothetical protein AKO1_014459 [Acrasis kona]|uniref:CTLH domain-containing protein n=1 Tax=Acrasis kona TaxID=1008807 RepID=A0AAW2YZY7_9EUKA
MRQQDDTVQDHTRFNLRKSDLVRVIVQALDSLSYHESAKILEKESGYRLHSEEITQFREGIMIGDWDKVSSSLKVLNIEDDEKETCVKFLINKQKYLEQLEKMNINDALSTLRKELSPNATDPNQLHKLASLLMCSNQNDLYNKAGWDGSSGRSRKDLIDDLHKYIPPALMVPENRLEKLLLQAVEYQKQSCLIGDDSSLSLLYEQTSQSVLPTETTHTLEHHTDEVWHVQFSPDGKLIITTSADHTAILYETSKLHTPKCILRGHSDTVSYARFSPDSKRVLTCSEDRSVKLWNVQTGDCVATFSRHKRAVSAVAWLPNGKMFISAGGGSDRSVRKWSLDTFQQVSCLKVDYHIYDLIVDKNGRIIILGHNKKIYIYEELDEDPVHTLSASDFMTSLDVSSDGKFLLAGISREDKEGTGSVYIWDLTENKMLRELEGYPQTKFVIRSTFSGKNSSYVLCGGEDGKIYIWERNTGKLHSSLDGHISTVSCVAWNYAHPHMFASCSDDSTVRIWSK